MDYINAFVTMLGEMSPYILLGFLIAGILHAFIPSRTFGRYLSGTGLKSVLWAAAIGIPLPLCSCGVLPTAVSLRKSGASRAATTSFLIGTPQTGVDSIAATYSMLGLPFAILRPVAALVTALFGGLAVGAIERKTTDAESQEASFDATPLKPSFMGRFVEALRYGFFEMMQNIGKWLVIGLVVATLITVLVPDDFFSTYARYPLLNMLVVVLIAVPMYVCATGSIPIAAALMLKGMSPGCALVLLMAGPAANFASMLVVSQSMGKKATLCYLASIVLGAVGVGVLIDYLPHLRELFISSMPMTKACCTMHGMDLVSIVCSVILVAFLIVAMVMKYVKSYQLKNKVTMETKQFKVGGMECNHCKANVEHAITSIPGVTKVEVDLAKGIAYVDGDVDAQTVIDRINEAGYTCKL